MVKIITETYTFAINHPKRIVVGIATISFCLYYTFCLPKQLFNSPTSTVLFDENNELLGAHIAEDGQWRFPQNESIPAKFRAAITVFEDKRFIFHHGVDFHAFIRAVWQNIKARKVVSGGSTLSMQVVRIARGNKSRNLWQKVIEMIWAFRLEQSYSKGEILSLYASNAPFGGNVVGLDAASWRYYGRSPENLSWGEAATLAVLPNSPSLIFPGKNHDLLLAKRNRLLNNLKEEGFIDSLTCELAKLEPLPGKPLPLPQHAPHLMARIINDGKKGERVKTTVNLELQERITEITLRHNKELKQNDINNASVLVLDVETGNALAYVGNVFTPENIENGCEVDMITAKRSPGSILKPLLYASMLQDGEILPNSLVADIPTQLGGYNPKNYNLTYDGAVPAQQALARSLNVPAVRMLRDYGIKRFNYVLKRYGLTTLNQDASHYGLSIILGGSEVTIWDIGGVYASMARTLNHFNKYNSKYNPTDFHPPNYSMNNPYFEELSPLSNKLVNKSLLNAAPIWFTFEAMVEVSRPEEESNWEMFSSSQRIAWKTGTSYGYRDAWSVGVTSRYVVVVWVGNADGEGRPNLIGIKAAAPIMFEVFSSLKHANWFQKPYDDMEEVAICKESGHLASKICNRVDTLWIPNLGIRTEPCPYHRIIHLNSEGLRVNSNCASTAEMTHVPWFVLPPAMEWYYKSKHATYRKLPAFSPDCNAEDNDLRNMQFIYPKVGTKIYVPKELDGTPGETVFEVAHRNMDATIFWHLDDIFLGSTSRFHQMALRPEPGEHLITLIDESGEKLIKKFEIIGEKQQ